MTHVRGKPQDDSLSSRTYWPARVHKAITCAAVGYIVCCAGCTSPERSRALGDAGIAGKTIAVQVCSSCHGANGISVSPAFPNLAGQQYEYLTLQLSSFRSHRRSDPKGHEYMWGLASPLTDEQIASLGAYYAGQKSAFASPRSEKISTPGRLIYEHGDTAAGVPACVACHGIQAEGNKLFPRLAGQHADYLINQLKVFQRTDQRPDGTVMKGVSHSLTERNMKDVASYLESLAD
jgi:cytochrome c553